MCHRFTRSNRKTELDIHGILHIKIDLICSPVQMGTPLNNNRYISREFYGCVKFTYLSES